MKILAVGDSFIGSEYFKSGFEALEAKHEISYTDMKTADSFVPESESELRIAEFLGSPSHLAAEIGDADVLVVHAAPVTEEVLEAAPMLRLICCTRGGPINIDLEAASARGIPVANTPAKNAEAVADQTIAFMLMLARRFPPAQRMLADGVGIGESIFEGRQFIGEELRGRVLGLVGYGEVGGRVAARAVAFGMDVVIYDPFVSLGDDVAHVTQVQALPPLLKQARFVSLHARATADNVDLIGPAEFEAMQPGGYLINTARASLVDETALDEALATGRLGGAALDVVHPWPARWGLHRLLRHDNVVITPHIGGATEETLRRGVAMAAREVECLATGSRLVNVVNHEVVPV
jgi:D-3-phosphoglycerate dehydrogenase / 2-oxoglutarate reductase